MTCVQEPPYLQIGANSRMYIGTPQASLVSPELCSTSRLVSPVPKGLHHNVELTSACAHDVHVLLCYGYTDCCTGLGSAAVQEHENQKTASNVTAPDPFIRTPLQCSAFCFSRATTRRAGCCDERESGGTGRSPGRHAK